MIGNSVSKVKEGFSDVRPKIFNKAQLSDVITLLISFLLKVKDINGK